MLLGEYWDSCGLLAKLYIDIDKYSDESFCRKGH